MAAEVQLAKRAKPAVPARTPVQLKVWPLLAYWGLNALLAVGMKLSSPLATVHALLTAAAGVGLVLWSRRPVTAALVGAYIVGAEVLWRMNKAAVFWEYGKYLMVVVMLVSMVRTRRLQFPPLPVLYFLALVPSTLLTVMTYEWYHSRRLISGDLSGPLVVFVAACFFTRLKLTAEDRVRVFVTAIGPILGVAAVALYSTLTAGAINFTGNSNFTTSGKYGPNQVSGTLSLGALVAFLGLMHETKPRLKLLLFALMGYLTVQSVLTFSRTGLYLGTASCVVAAAFLLRHRRARALLIKVVAVVVGAAAVLVIPMLNSFTKGAFSERFTSTQVTSRDKIVVADFKIWQESPVLGVGTGQAFFYREKYLDMGSVAAHTEFSRLLAEHGLPGIFAGLLLFMMAFLNLRQARSPIPQATVAATIAWSFLCMAANGVRLTAPCYVFGLSFAVCLPAVLRGSGVKASRVERKPLLHLLRPVPGQSLA